MTSATFPADLLEKLETYQDSPDKIYQIGIDHAIKQCLDLLEKRCPGHSFLYPEQVQGGSGGF